MHDSSLIFNIQRGAVIKKLTEMLQWMGGSRRKVTTSRKSTQKRQKQYFEQRKRQQQEQDTVFTENNAEGSISSDHQKRNRSLDISSLLNVSKVTEECKPSCGIESLPSMTKKTNCGSSVKEVDSSQVRKSESNYFSAGQARKSEGSYFSASYHTSMSIPTGMSDQLTATEYTGTRVSPLHQVGRVSSKSPMGNTSTGENRELEYLKSDSSYQLSIFDIIGDDGAIGTAEEAVQEAHVAFSVEGLGKVGIKTPMQSPQHHGSTLAGEQLFRKDAKNFSTRKNFNTVLDDLEMEVECLLQDDKLPSHHSCLSFSSTEPELLTFNDGMQLDSKQFNAKSLYDEDRHDSFWNADTSSHLLESQVNEKCGVNRTRYDTTNSSFWRNDLSDFKFKKYYTSSLDTLPRCQEHIPDRLNKIDGDSCFSSLSKPKFSFLHDFPQDDLFPMKREDTRDNLTSLSGESCSSTAVGGESTADMPSARHSRRYGKGLDMPSMSNINEDYDEGLWNTKASTLTHEEEFKTSRKHVRSKYSHPKSALFSQAHVNECEDYRLFEAGFPSKVNSQPRSLFASLDRNQHCRANSFDLDTDADFRRSDFRFDDFEKDTFYELSSENFAFQQSFGSRQSYNTSFISQPVFRESSCEVFGGIDSAFPAPELSEQGSVIEEGMGKSKSEPSCPEPKNTSPESRLPMADTALKGSHNVTNKAIYQEEAAHALEPDAEETSLPIKFQHESDDELNTPTKESQGIIPVQCQQTAKGRDVEDDNLRGHEPKTTLIDPCYQIMTVERYVLKLFSVPKGKAAVWNAVKLF